MSIHIREWRCPTLAGAPRSAHCQERPWFLCLSASSHTHDTCHSERLRRLRQPTHTAPSPRASEVCPMEMQHHRVEQACPGDNVALNIESLDKNDTPRSGDETHHQRLDQTCLSDNVALDIKGLDKNDTPRSGDEKHHQRYPGNGVHDVIQQIPQERNSGQAAEEIIDLPSSGIHGRNDEATKDILKVCTDMRTYEQKLQAIHEESDRIVRSRMNAQQQHLLQTVQEESWYGQRASPPSRRRRDNRRRN